MNTWKPATTYFCENGHLLEDNPIFQNGKYDEILRYTMTADLTKEDLFPECPCCGNNKVRIVTDWHGKNKETALYAI